MPTNWQKLLESNRDLNICSVKSRYYARRIERRHRTFSRLRKINVSAPKRSDHPKWLVFGPLRHRYSSGDHRCFPRHLTLIILLRAWLYLINPAFLLHVLSGVGMFSNDALQAPQWATYGTSQVHRDHQMKRRTLPSETSRESKMRFAAGSNTTRKNIRYQSHPIARYGRQKTWLPYPLHTGRFSVMSCTTVAAIAMSGTARNLTRLFNLFVTTFEFNYDSY